MSPHRHQFTGHVRGGVAPASAMTTIPSGSGERPTSGRWSPPWAAFIAGAAFSLREGISELVHPTTTSSFMVAYLVLEAATIFDLPSLRQSAYQMSTEARLANRSILRHTDTTSDPSLRGVFNEDAVSILGDIFAWPACGLGTLPSRQFPKP